MSNQEPAQPDNFRLSSPDEDKRPLEILEHADEESGRPEDALLPIEEEAKGAKRGNKMMLLWILVNTLATIGIVSLAGLQEMILKLRSKSSRSSPTKQFSTTQNFAIRNSVSSHITSLLPGSYYTGSRDHDGASSSPNGR